MAVQDNRKPGFLTPIKPVEVSSSTGNPRVIENQRNQRVQGGQALGGGQNNSNNAGNTGVESSVKSNDKYSITKKGLSGIGPLLSDVGSAAKNVGSSVGKNIVSTGAVVGTGLLYGREGLDRLKASAPATTSTPVVDAAELQRKALGTGPTVSSPSSFNLPNLDKEVSSGKVETPQGSLNNVFTESSKTYGSAESKPSTYYTPSGEQRQALGGVTYTRDSAGNILKKDRAGNVSTLENNISSIGPNGSTVSRDLTDKEKEAMARSSQMISDWQDYKRQKEAQGLRNFIQNNLGNQYITSSQRQEATDRLNAIEKGDIDKQQIASQEGIQSRTLGATVRKNAFEEQKETARLGIDSLKAQSEVQGRLASQQNDTFKLIGEVDKNLGSTQDKIAVYKSRGMWNPLTIKATYPKEKLGSFKTPDELRQNLVNDESVDQGDIEDIVFSYFPSNQ